MRLEQGAEPGDVVRVTVWNAATQQGTLHGGASLENERTGLATNVALNPPGEVATEPGTEVEWIVEAPACADLPDFHSVAFLDCSAGTRRESFGLRGAALTEIEGAAGALTRTEIVGSDTLVVIWGADR